jgi:hypothetical protein
MPSGRHEVVQLNENPHWIFNYTLLISCLLKLSCFNFVLLILHLRYFLSLIVCVMLVVAKIGPGGWVCCAPAAQGTGYFFTPESKILDHPITYYNKRASDIANNWGINGIIRQIGNFSLSLSPICLTLVF